MDGWMDVYVCFCVRTELECVFEFYQRKGIWIKTDNLYLACFPYFSPLFGRFLHVQFGQRWCLRWPAPFSREWTGWGVFTLVPTPPPAPCLPWTSPCHQRVGVRLRRGGRHHCTCRPHLLVLSVVCERWVSRFLSYWWCIFIVLCFFRFV